MRVVNQLLPLRCQLPIPKLVIRLILALCCCVTYGQAQSDKQPQRGYTPGGAYSLGEIESISATGGNLMLKIPLASLPTGRGGSPGFTLNLFYNSKIYDPNTQRMPNRAGQMTTQTFIDASPGANWKYGLLYELEVIDKRSETRYVDQNGPNCTTDFQNFPKLFKVRVRSPDGGMHEFRPLYEAANEKDGYYTITPDGSRYYCSGCTFCPVGSETLAKTEPTYATRTYYSVDGSYIRLDIRYAPPDVNGHRAQYWTLYFPDGNYVTNDIGAAGGPNVGQRRYDRNGNYTEIIASGQNGAQISDQLGRKIVIQHDEATKQDHIDAKGFADEPLRTTVRWKDIRVNKTIRTGAIYNGGGDAYDYTRSFRVVEQITLPEQSGLPPYRFSYNADSANPSHGWGEVSSVVVPTGARADYTYRMDGLHDLTANVVLKNHPVRKDLTYLEEYDGVSRGRTDRWTFQLGTGGIESYNNARYSQMTGPDGGVLSEYFYSPEDSANPLRGLVYETRYPDGKVVQKEWRTNNVYETNLQTALAPNPYVKTEYMSMRDAAGNLTKTAIKDYNYDKNGNVTRVAEYDWVNHADIGDPSSNALRIPGGALPKRVTTSAYYNPTPDASDSTSNDPDSYSNPTPPRLRNAVASVEVGDGFQTSARTEYTYDDPSTTGNLTEQKSWDSQKGPYSNPLTPSNSVSTSSQYDAYGNRRLTTDARGHRTQWAYGAVGTVTDLYPTEVKTAFETDVQQTVNIDYDLYTGVVTRFVDPNGAATVTEYDDFGRPTWVKRAVGTLLETHTRTIYADAERRVITRSNLDSKADAKLVSVTHYDQLGRARLARRLEDFSALMATDPTVAETDETVGIKVQTRYLYSGQNSYHLVSNPYRAARSGEAGGEATMGWSLTKSDSGGRVVEVRSFSGSGLPTPWGADPATANTVTTGAVTTFYDGEFTTVTDQAGKQRRHMIDGLGRIERVDEPTDSGLGSPAAPSQPTCYAYDALSNLTRVRQGGQWQKGQCQNSPQPDRVFQYSSLSRLISAANPESGTTQYKYDNNGNLVLKIDPRPGQGTLSLQDCPIPYAGDRVISCYKYDGLDRVTSRAYNDGTPNVAYFYDSQKLPGGAPTFDRGMSVGRLIAVTYGGGAAGYYVGGYDELGGAGLSRQVTDAGTGEGLKTYAMAYSYDLAGNLTSQIYPSGRMVKSEYDAAGRLAGVRNGTSGPFYAGGAGDDASHRAAYAAHGGISALRLGNGLWEHTSFNSRLQTTEIGLGSSPSDSSLLRLGYTYSLLANGTLDTTRNNGNLQRQMIATPVLALQQTYEYDGLNRLKAAREDGSSEAWKQVYSYDAFGNRRFDAGTSLPAVSQGQEDALWNPSVSGTNNRIKTAGYVYDHAGNLTRKPDARGDFAYAYDAEGRMVEADNAGQPYGKAVYAYDGDGRRVRKVTGSGGAVTVFVYDAFGKLVAEYTSSAPAQGGTQYLTSDHLGSPRVVTDSAGNAKSRHDYLPFGEELFAGVGGRASAQGYGADDVRQKFTGYQRDMETGLDFAQARYYASQHGRFTSPDPLLASGETSNPQSWNRYAYVFNNPLGFIDPDGQKARPDDYHVAADGTITVDQTNDSFDRFYVETQCGAPYLFVAQLEKNDKGQVKFPDSGTGFDRYGPTPDAGGISKDAKTGKVLEVVGEGDHYLQPQVAAALFGLTNALSYSGITISLGDMSSSNGSDPWEQGQKHHGGHGHNGNRSGLDVDFRYLNGDGVSFQSRTATSDTQFSAERNQLVYDTGKTFGFTANYQGTRSSLSGPTRDGRHNDHGHLGFGSGSNVTIRTRRPPK